MKKPKSGDHANYNNPLKLMTSPVQGAFPCGEVMCGELMNGEFTCGELECNYIDLAHYLSEAISTRYPD